MSTRNLYKVTFLQQEDKFAVFVASDTIADVESLIRREYDRPKITHIELLSPAVLA